MRQKRPRPSQEDLDLVNEVTKDLYNFLDDASIFTLPGAAQIVAIVESTQGYIDNGGFGSFFEGDWPGNPPYSIFVNAFRTIGADETAKLIEDGAALFPFPDPHLNGDARRNYLRTQCMHPDGRTNWDAPLLKLGDRAMDQSVTNTSLLARYIREHSDEIEKVTDS